MKLTMKAKILLILTAVLLVFPCQIFPQKKSPKDLPPQFKKWLEEEVVFITTSLEKDVFLQLGTDKERKLFIEAFWKQRDPTQGTPTNEFKEEHYQRIQHANYTFGRSAPIPGWKTDRGRFYILLGEPRDIERFSGEAQIYNSEIWFYQGLSKYGLPAGFQLVFFQKGGVGDYILYSPTRDGPQALLTSYFGDQSNYDQAFKKLKQVSLSLARVSLSLIPGESAQFGRPSLSSDILLQNIQSLPEKAVNNMYAQKFLMYKDIVEVEYTANYIDSDSVVQIIKEDSGQYFVHYSIELNKLSVQSFEDKYTTNLKINGQISNLEGITIYQYEGSLPIEINANQLKSLTYKPFDLYDMFPLIPGNYKFSVLLKNEASQEFTSLEKDIFIPEEEAFPRLSGLLLGYKTEPITSLNLIPFKIGKQQVLSQPKNIFLLQDKIFLYFQIFGAGPELKEKGSLKYEIFREEESVLSFSKKVNAYKNELNISEEFALEEFSPGFYWLKVSLLDGEQTLHSEREPFEITPVSSFPRPWLFSKTLEPSSHPSHSFVLGRQYFNQGKTKKALFHLERAFHSQPNFEEYAVVLARLYLRIEEYEKAKTILLPFQESSKVRYEVYFFLGQAHRALGEFDYAISVFNRAITHYGINILILNSIGDCYHRLGNITEALAAWDKSLELFPTQPEIEKKINSIKK